jgi:hypothetical protein
MGADDVVPEGGIGLNLRADGLVGRTAELEDRE